MFIVTTMVAAFFHALVVLPSIYFLTVRKNPYRLLIGVGKALVTAFGTSSKSVLIPIVYSSSARLFINVIINLTTHASLISHVQ